MSYKPAALQFPADAQETEVRATAPPWSFDGMTALPRCHVPRLLVSNSPNPEAESRPSL
jgi:hypothetical protein